LLDTHVFLILPYVPAVLEPEPEVKKGALDISNELLTEAILIFPSVVIVIDAPALLSSRPPAPADSVATVFPLTLKVSWSLITATPVPETPP
jgi:hypothetical protein